MCAVERFPHKPYIKDGFPFNKTVLPGERVVFECPTMSDLEPFIQWLRVNYSGTANDSDNNMVKGILLQVVTVEVPY